MVTFYAWLHFTLTSGLFQIRSSVVKSNNPEEYWLAIDTDTSKIIPAHVNAYKYFGGVTRIIQCDNLKTGVQKHGKDEVVLNKSYQELAEHYGTAILPARVRAPKDKAAVESTVGIISTFILAALRNRQFLSLLELNEAIWDRLEMFNHKPFQKREGSRASSFAEERSLLRPLPPRPFELAIWKVATVGPNYHISVERMNYSVPFEYIKQKVDVRLTRATVEVFYGGNRICSHPRLYGRFSQYYQQTGVASTRLDITHPYNRCGATVANILSNPVYLGHTLNMQSSTLSYKNKQIFHRPPEEQVLVKNTHEAIIDQELWDTVQRIREHKHRPPKQMDAPGLFAGLVYCAQPRIDLMVTSTP